MHKHMIVAPKTSFAFAATGTELTARIDNDGFISHIILVLPNFTNVVTGLLTIKDDDGNVIWTDASGPRAKNATYVIAAPDIPATDIPVLSGFTLVLTLSGDAGAGGGTATARCFIGS